MISLFEWNASFQTQIPAVDEQHHHLVGMINELSQMLIDSDQLDLDVFNRTRDGIVEYTRVHFTSEEGLMRSAGLDRRHVELHTAQHKVFINEVLALVSLGDQVDLSTARKLAEFLIHWLAYHILEVDQVMARQIHAIQAGKLPGDAYEEIPARVDDKSQPLLSAMTGLFLLVSDRNRALRLLNHELERRVRERTQALSEANARLESLTVHDELTGLHNRRYAILTLERLWQERNRYGGGLSVLMIDADHFKFVNDQFGHAVGDDVLKALAAHLNNSVRRSDIVCRLGGDEFLIICPRNTFEGVTHLASKILASSRPVLHQGTVCWDGSISIGRAEADINMSGYDDLIKAADTNLYTAKRNGGGCMA